MNNTETSSRFIIFFVLILGFALVLGFLSSQSTPTILIWGMIALAIFVLSFLKIEFGLYILIFSMLLSPEIMIGETQGGSLSRGVTLRLEDFLLVVIGFGWFAQNAVNKELGLFLRTPLNKAIFLYVFSAVLATGFGIMAGNVSAKTGFFFVLKYIEYFIVYFMMANHVKNEEQIKRFLFCLFLTCFITSIIGILQIPGGGRVSAPFEGTRGEPNTLGGYLLFIGLVAAGLFSKAENNRLRNALALLIVVIIPPFLFTLSRTSYLAFVPGIVTLGFLMDKKAIVGGIFLLLLAVSPLFLPGQVKERMLYTFDQPVHRDQIKIGDMRLDTSTSARIASWQEALRDWTKRPVLGYGVTGYQFVDAQFPRVLTETGIIGLMAFIYLLYSIWKTAYKNYRELKTPYFKGITVGYMAGFVGLVVHSIGANTFIIVRIMEPFWFFTGILVTLPMLEERRLTGKDMTA